MIKDTGIRRFFAGLAITALVVAGMSPLATAGELVTSGVIRDVVKQYFERHMPWERNAARFEFSGEVEDVSVSASSAVCRVVRLNRQDFIGDINVTVGFFNKGVCLDRRLVRVRMDVLRGVVVAARYIPRNAVIGEEDVTVVSRWFHAIPSGVVTRAEDVTGMRACSSIPPRADVTRNMIREPIVVKRGKMVRVVLEQGPLHLSTVGLSEEDGARGDVVRIQNLSSKKKIYGTVMGDSLVMVTY